MSNRRQLELKLESVLATVDAAELCAKGLAREGGYDDDRIDRLGMAVREAVANAVTHGNVYSSDKWVHFSVELDNEKLTVKVSDEGTGFNPEDIPDPTSAENILKASGRGLLMMRALVDQVELNELSPSGTEVVLTLLGATATEDGKED